MLNDDNWPSSMITPTPVSRLHSVCRQLMKYLVTDPPTHFRLNLETEEGQQAAEDLKTSMVRVTAIMLRPTPPDEVNDDNEFTVNGVRIMLAVVPAKHNKHYYVTHVSPLAIKDSNK